MASTARPALRPSLPRPILLLGHLLEIATKTPAEVAKPPDGPIAEPSSPVATAPLWCTTEPLLFIQAVAEAMGALPNSRVSAAPKMAGGSSSSSLTQCSRTP